MEIFAAPIDLDLPGEQRVQPDLVVVERGRTGPRLSLPVALVVESSRPARRPTTGSPSGLPMPPRIPAYRIVDHDRGIVTCLVLDGAKYRVGAEGHRDGGRAGIGPN